MCLKSALHTVLIVVHMQAFEGGQQAVGGCPALLQLAFKGQDRQNRYVCSLSEAMITDVLVRLVLDAVSKVPGSVKVQVDLCKECIEWAKEEKRTFLRQRLETKLASLYIQTKDYNLSLALLAQLLKEVKKLDDKPLLVELHLIESQVPHPEQSNLS